MFEEHYKLHTWANVSEQIADCTSAQVERALNRRGRRSLEDFMALISPAAGPYLETMAQKSYTLTRKRFGNVIQFYIPVYLSNECQNICTYCGFSLHNKIPRLTLSPERLRREFEIVKGLGFEHVLLVSGEANKSVGVEYFEQAIDLAAKYFSNISLEVQPLSQAEYTRLIERGLHSVLVYQETYNLERYKEVHPKGRKANFWHRLETPDRLGQAGIRKIGLGSLIGLSDWPTDAWFTALHLSYLERTYWQTKFSISFPRLRPAEGYETPAVVMSDSELVQLVCAYRLFNENLELSLSTRETPNFRDNLVGLGITSISAGSRTEPGGYAEPAAALEQFDVSDERTPAEVASMLRSRGLEPVWKDWDSSLNHRAANDSFSS